jgi:hypothetical protein
MNGWPALDRFLRTDPRDVGCAEAMEMLHIYAELAAGDPVQRYPGIAEHLCACGPCGKTSKGCWPRRATRPPDRRPLLAAQVQYLPLSTARLHRRHATMVEAAPAAPAASPAGHTTPATTASRHARFRLMLGTSHRHSACDPPVAGCERRSEPSRAGATQHPASAGGTNGRQHGG